MDLADEEKSLLQNLQTLEKKTAISTKNVILFLQ